MHNQVPACARYNSSIDVRDKCALCPPTRLFSRFFPNDIQNDSSISGASVTLSESLSSASPCSHRSTRCAQSGSSQRVSSVYTIGDSSGESQFDASMYSAPLAGLSGYNKFSGSSFHGSATGTVPSTPTGPSGGVALAWENINVYKPLPIYDQLTARLNSTTEDGQLILKQLNGVIHFGQMFAIMGPSGAGKSTLLKCLFGTANVKHDGKMYVQNKQVRFQINLTNFSLFFF